jgi:flavin reductase (DIM6/NTAB) family NADH-FMN oxidoreductase RutF
MKVEIPGPKAYRLLYPRHVVLVSCIDPATEKPNIITLAWSTPLSMDPPLVGISVAPKRYSHGLIQESKEFVINVPPMEILQKVAGCGSVSGRSVDKFSRFGLTPKRAKVVKAPAIEECFAHLECRLVDQVKTGDHTLFIGEVVAAYASEEAFDGNLISVKGIRGVYQVGGQTYCTLAPDLAKLD